jgi:vacuolar-type H+-ATPase subunit H
MKILKKILLIAAITIFAIFLILLVTPILFKGKILTIAKTELNKMLEAQVDFSDLKLSFIRNFPNAFVGLENLTVTGKGEFEGETLAAFKSFSVTVDIKSVIKMDNIRVKSILLDQARINAHIAENGNANWNIMKPGKEEEKPSEGSPPAEKKETEKASALKVALNKFEIRGAKLSFQDDKGKMTASVNDLNFFLHGDMSLDNAVLKMKLDIADINFLMGGIRMLTNARAGFVSEVAADLKNMVFFLKDNKFNLNEIILKFAGNVQMPGDIIVDMTFATETIDFKNVLALVPSVFMKGFESIKTTGTFALSGDIKGTYNNKQMPNANVKLTVDNAMFKYPDLPKSVDNINIKVNAFYDGAVFDRTTLDLDKLHFEMAGNPFDAELHVKTPESDLQAAAKFLGKIDFNSIVDIVPLDNITLKGLLECDFALAGRMSTLEKKQFENFDASGMLKLSGLDFKSPDFPQAVKINSTRLNLSPRKVDLAEFDAVIGKSDIALNGTLENFIPYVFKGSTVSGNLNLKSNNIDLNEFMGGSKEKEPVEKKQEDSSPMNVIEVPKNIDFAMKINIGSLLFDKLKITDTAGSILVKDGKVQMQNLGMKLLDGSMNLTGEYNTQNIKVPSVDFGLNIKQFDVKSAISSFEILEKILPQPQNYDGKVSANLTLNSVLDEHMSPVMNSLASKGQLQTHNLKIQNSELFATLANLLKNESLRTPTLNNVNIKFEIKDGQVMIEPVRMNIAQAALELSGSQSLDMSLNYKLNASVPASAVGSGATDILSKIPGGVKINEFKLTGLIGGTAAKPVVTLSIADMASSVVSAVKDAVIEKVSDEVNKQINAIMAEAEKQAQNLRNAAKQTADRIRQEANNAANKLESEAKNPLQKVAAKTAADALRKEGENNAVKAEQEAERQIKTIMDNANKKANDLRKG